MLENLITDAKITNCKVRTYYETLDKKDADLLRSYVDDAETWTAYALSNALAKRGVTIDSKIITKHRGDMCSCKEYNARQLDAG